MLTEILRHTGHKLNPNALLIGFARRAATYKRGDLIFRDRAQLIPLLNSGQLQLVFSGKAHPQDQEGKNVLSNIVSLTKEFPGKVVFLENYDMGLGVLLTRGCDVWLNNPQRPMEASATSGMKAAMNGVLNFSTLDGWWVEGCKHGLNGWQFGDGYVGPGQDKHDLKELYQTLKTQVIPTFYHNKQQWEKMMRVSIKTSTEEFSARRMVREYYKRLYSPTEELHTQIS